MSGKNLRVTVTAFINPHVFWICNLDDEKCRNDLEENINGEIVAVAKKTLCIDEVVAVKDGKFWKRAIVKGINQEESISYICWLIDYGVIFETTVIYNLPEQYKLIPSFVKQAALNNVVAIKQVFGPMNVEYETHSSFNAGVVRLAHQYINEAYDVLFSTEKESNGVIIGDLYLYGKDGVMYDMTSLLVESKNLAINEKEFQKFFELNCQCVKSNFITLHKTAKVIRPDKSPTQLKIKDVELISETLSGRQSRCSLKQDDNFVKTWVEDTKNAFQIKDEDAESETECKSDEITNYLIEEKTNSVTSESEVDVEATDSVSQSGKLSCLELSRRLYKLRESNRAGSNSFNAKVECNSNTDVISKSNLNVSSNTSSYSSHQLHSKKMKQQPVQSLEYSKSVSENEISALLDKNVSNCSAIQHKATDVDFTPKFESTPKLAIPMTNQSKRKSLFQQIKTAREQLLNQSRNSDKQSDEVKLCDYNSSEQILICSDIKKDISNTSYSNEKLSEIKQNNLLGSGQDEEVMSIKNTSKSLNWSSSSIETKKDKRASDPLKKLNILPSGMSSIMPLSAQNKIKKPKVNISCSNKITPQTKFNSDNSSSQNSNSYIPRNSVKPKSGENSTNYKSCAQLNETAVNKIHTKLNPCTQIGCKCEKCLLWNSEESYYLKTKQSSETKEKKDVVKPTLLLKSENDEETTLVQKGLQLNKSSRIEKFNIPKVLVHGCSIPMPFHLVSDVAFHPDIHHSLNILKFEKASRIQTYVWPAIMRRLNVCLINGPRSGKTMAYLPAICSYVQDRFVRYPNLPRKQFGPIAIVLCNGSRVAERIFKIVQNLYNPIKAKPNIALAVPPLDKSRLVQFQQQCDILVATPIILISLLRSKIINLKRLCHLVIENGDQVLNKFSKEINDLLDGAQSMLSHRICNYTLQFIITSEYWTLQIENLMKKLYSQPLICIGSYLEAALYGRANMLMHFFDSVRKAFTLINILKDKSHIYKTVVVCNEESEIEEVKESLKVAGIGAIIIENSMDLKEINELETHWIDAIGGKYLLMLCTDETLQNSINIHDATLLIHYSLPKSWTHFAKRFSCLLYSYSSPLVNSSTSNVQPDVHIFVDEKCTLQFPRLVEFLQKMGVKPSSKFVEFNKKLLQTKEENKVDSNVQLCRYLKYFGKCPIIKCNYRHILSPKLDIIRDIPKSGIIKFKLLHITDVTSYTIKILEHTDLDGYTHLKQTFDKLDEELSKEIKKSDSVTNVQLGGWYALHMINLDLYRRCEVLQINELVVQVKLLDIGTKMNVSVNDLYELPNKFKTIVAQGVDIIIANLIPPDCDENWSSDIKSKLIGILKDAEYNKENLYFESKILLQLGNTLWVEDLRLVEELSLSDVKVTKLMVKKLLINNNFANYAEGQLAQLYSMCENADIQLPDYNNFSENAKKIIQKSQAQILPQWAYFEDNVYNEVYFCAAVTPDQFYLRLKKFDNLFHNLQKDIQTSISKPFYPDKFEIEIGKCYLAKDPGGDEYCRIKVIDIKDDIVDCFFVDFGDQAFSAKGQLKYLGNDLITKLPFQAIECRLYGTSPSLDCWSPEATDILYKYCFEPNTEYFRTLYITFCKEELPVLTNGQKYAILLVDNYLGKLVLINQLMIECGVAVENTGEDLKEEMMTPPKASDNDLDSNDSMDDVEELQQTDLNKSVEEKSDRSPSRMSDESHHSWDFEIFDQKTFMKDLFRVNTKTGANNGEQTQPLHPIKALPSTGYSTPEVKWHQTISNIKLNIMLPHLNEYDIKIIRGKVLYFLTTYNGKEYRLNLQLFEKVDKTFQHSSLGLYVKVVLKKVNENEWPRLVITTERLRCIKYDTSHFDFTDEPEKRRFLTLGKDSDEEIVDDEKMFYTIGSDEDYGESDIDSDVSD